MSSNSFAVSSTRGLRAKKTGVKSFFTAAAGVKSAAKKTMHRMVRQQQNRELPRLAFEELDVSMMTEVEKDALQTWLDEYNDRLLDGLDSDSAWLADNEAEECPAEAEAKTEMPALLQASLPDWMLTQVEEANGDSFALLSLFEAKSLSPSAARRFAASRADDGEDYDL